LKTSMCPKEGRRIKRFLNVFHMISEIGLSD